MSRFHDNKHPSVNTYAPDITTSKDSFIEAFLSTEDALQFNHAAIQSVCASKGWREDVVFTCDYIAGGIGNVRNHLLNCIRYAIEAGGSLVIPGVMRRNQDDISEIDTEDWMDLGYLFDKEWFLEHLSTACPELKLWQSLDDIPASSNGTMSQKIKLLPGSLDSWVPRWGLAHPTSWRAYFDQWLDVFRDDSSAQTYLVGIGRAYLEFPVMYDGEKFVEEFGKILRFRKDARVLAGVVLWELQRKFFHERAIIVPGDRVSANTYFGVHLRTESDAVKAWPEADWKFQRYSIQSTLAIEEISHSTLKVVYIASGNTTEVARFANDAHASTMLSDLAGVVTKHDLLFTEDKKALDSFTFDQAAMVDFMVMEKSSRFAGIGHSSFAWNIALRRHLLVKKQRSYLSGPNLLHDSLSDIWGVTRSYVEYSNCMWP
ncbi:hypothetical protein BP5796_03501 [Coleophoma crateriformis]|uniref:Alternative oxidase n=1 Tax=Coleophoma crateriformis TaxID=565419 RepID=A0A3D8SNB0_9HELO|nr:hypothetical protein BP5796_03501 [Coleophoma crateriformis]